MSGYFRRISEAFQTRVWINNPTLEEVTLALNAGAIHCTTNPAYTAKMLASETEGGAVRALIRQAVEAGMKESAAAAWVQRMTISRLFDAFLPVWKESGGARGLVSIQCDPFAEHDPQAILDEAEADLKHSPNALPKIPATHSGLEAMRVLMEKGVPVIATEVMALSQAVAVGEMALTVRKKRGQLAPVFLTHISGIFDDHLKNEARRRGLSLSPEAMAMAGCMVARHQYAWVTQRGYPVTMLGGGARGPQHFTEMAGGTMHVTLNWKGGMALLEEMNPPVESRLMRPADPALLAELGGAFPEVVQAMDPEGLSIRDFEHFGPVVLFRNSFEKGWEEVLEAIRAERAVQV